MGWTVYVHEYVAHVATCSEPDCGWRGTDPAPNRQHAEQEADAHVRAHAEAWQRLNGEWERTHEDRLRMRCPTCGGPVDLLDWGTDAGLYRCRSPRTECLGSTRTGEEVLAGLRVDDLDREP